MINSCGAILKAEAAAYSQFLKFGNYEISEEAHSQNNIFRNSLIDFHEISEPVIDEFNKIFTNTSKQKKVDQMQFFQDLKRMINQPKSRGFVLFLTGKSLLGQNQVKLEMMEVSYLIPMFQFLSDPNKYWSLHVEDLLEIWDERKNKEMCCQFLIIADFVGSETWVDYIKSRSSNDVLIQTHKASSKNLYFMRDILVINELLGTNQKLTEIEHQPIFAPNIDEVKEKAYHIFGLKVGFNSFIEMKNANYEQKSNCIFYGQSSLFSHPEIGLQFRKPHGVGIVLDSFSRVVLFGEFNEGKCIRKIIIRVLDIKDVKNTNFEKKQLSYHEKFPEKDEEINTMVDFNGISIQEKFNHLTTEKTVTLRTFFGIEWVGPTFRKCPNGVGKMKFQGRFIIDGLFINGSFSEIYQVCKKQKSKFVKIEFSRFEDEKKNESKYIVDRFGNILKTDYERAWINEQNFYEGEGELFTNHGYVIKATFLEGLISNLYNLEFMGIKLNGKLMCDALNGHGIFVDKIGNVYEGHVKDGKRHGFGIIKTIFGEHYEADFINGDVVNLKSFFNITGQKALSPFSKNEFAEIIGWTLRNLNLAPFFTESRLISAKHIQVLFLMIPEIRQTHLLMNSELHGSDYNTFHQLCDEKGPTVVICRSQNLIIGGFTDKKWSSSNKFKISSKSFLFNIKGQYGKQFSLKQQSESIFCGKETGIFFGNSESPDGFLIS